MELFLSSMTVVKKMSCSKRFDFLDGPRRIPPICYYRDALRSERTAPCSCENSIWRYSHLFLQFLSLLTDSSPNREQKSGLISLLPGESCSMGRGLPPRDSILA